MKGKKIWTICVLTLVCTMALSATGIANTINEIGSSGNNNPQNAPVIDGPCIGTTKERLYYDITLKNPDIDVLMIDLEVDFGDEIMNYYPRSESFWRDGDVVLVDATKGTVEKISE